MSDDDDHGGLGEHLHVQPGGDAVAESGHADAVESLAAKLRDDLPGVLGIAIHGDGLRSVAAHTSTVAHFIGHVLEKSSVARPRDCPPAVR